jgi:Luciferase
MKLAARLCSLGLEQAPSRWGADPAFWWRGREIVHTHSDFVEVRLTRKGIRELEDDRAMLRARTSDWVMVGIEHEDLIVELAERARALNSEEAWT